ncbi:MAG: helix-turn-helix domain-containing protein [Gammaproteobacteria bacterium]
MEPIPLFRAAHLLPYIQLLAHIGAPVDSGLRRAKLPIMLVDQPGARVPLLQTLDFLTDMAHCQGIEDLALRAREHASIKELSPVMLNTISSAPTLKTALEAAFRLARLENSQLDIWMVAEKHSVRIYNRHRVPFDLEGARHLEFNTSMWLLAIIRAFAGSQWCPKEMAFESTLRPGRYASELFPNTRFHIGQKAPWISLPDSLLALPPLDKQPANRINSSVDSQTDVAIDFPGSLKELLKSYLGAGYPCIELTAEIAGTSKRTLQRRLDSYNLSYSELIHQVQFESARKMLTDSDTKIVDIAYAVGYEDPSNFSRAFRRIAGVSPKLYRAQHGKHSIRH